MIKALKKIDDKFDPRIAKKQEALNTIQGKLDELIAEKEDRIERVNKYFKAKQDKAEIDEIIRNKPIEIE